VRVKSRSAWVRGRSVKGTTVVTVTPDIHDTDVLKVGASENPLKTVLGAYMS
ncbi:hypothetical protein PtrCC142_006876, partial [Pyrenophora tritici-repentis]